MRLCTIAAYIFLLLTIAASAFAVDTIDNLKVGNMTLSFNPQDGFKLDYRGATVITESGLHAAKPGWLAVYYSYESGDKNIEIKDIPNGNLDDLTLIDWRGLRTPWAEATLAWQTDSPDGQRISLREIEWKNSRPDVEIKSIEISSTGTDGAPLLIGLSGISVK